MSYGSRYIKVLNDNECVYDECTSESTCEGLLCRAHWDLVPGQLKGHYQSCRKQVLMAVHAAETLRKRRG